MVGTLRLLLRALAREVVGSPDIVALAAQRAARRKGLVWGRTLYAGVLLAIVALMLSKSARASDLPSYGSYLFASLCAIQLAVAVFVPPVLMAHAIAEERSRGTIGLLLMTHRSADDVVRALLTTRLLVVVLILLAGGPVASMAAMLGGVSLDGIVYLIIGSLLIAVAGGALGALLGADAPPRAAPVVAFLGALMSLWLAHYPVVFGGIAVAFLIQAGIPALAVAGLVLVVSGPPILVIHRFLTHHAGLTLLRRIADPQALPPPPPIRPTKAAPVRKGPRHGQLMKVLSPGLHWMPTRVLAYVLLAAACMALCVAAIPEDPEWARVVKGAFTGLLAASGFGILGVTVAAATLLPVLRLTRLRNDATLVLVALCPLDLPALFRTIEKKAIVLAALGSFIAAALLFPITGIDSDLDAAERFAAFAIATTMLACLVLCLMAFSMRIGASARSAMRGLSTVLGAWIALFASLLFVGLGDVSIVWHPLVLPFACGMGKLDGPEQLLVGGLFAPIAYLLSLGARRRLEAIWREPFDALADGPAAFE